MKMFQSPSVIHASWKMQLSITPLFSQWMRSVVDYISHDVLCSPLPVNRVMHQ